jgi:hypothetical protein
VQNLLDFAIHCRQNKTQSWENTRVKTARVQSVVPCDSCCRLANLVTLCELGLPSDLSRPVTVITVQELSDKPHAACILMVKTNQESGVLNLLFVPEDEDRCHYISANLHGVNLPEIVSFTSWIPSCILSSGK